MNKKWSADVLKRGSVVIAVLVLWGGHASVGAQEKADMAQSVAVLSARVAVEQGKINDFHLPTTSSQKRDLDQKCLEGPRAFFEALTLERADGRFPKSWSSFGSIAKDPLRYCHLQIDEYRKAQVAQSALPVQRVEPVDAGTSRKAVKYPRWPTNPLEKAELDAAARKSIYDCYAWILGPEEAKKEVNFPPGTKFSQLVHSNLHDVDERQCESVARRAKTLTEGGESSLVGEIH